MFLFKSSSGPLVNELPVMNEARPATGHSRLRRSLSTVKRWLREPLLHFLLIGLLLFGVYAYINRGRIGIESPRQIVLSLDELRTMTAYFESQWHRPATPKEFQAMVEDKIKEEVLYREGLAMGLDKDDTIVKRRMAQKVQFLAEDVASAHEPSTAELKAWFEKNTDKFALPGRYSFRHIYFSPDKRGTKAHDDATKALAGIVGQPEDSPLIPSVADRFMFQDYYGDRTPSAIAKEFGPQFAVALEKLKPGSWQGPIESGYGWHLVFVDTVIPGRIPAFEEVEPDVKTAWLGDQKALAWDKAYKEMRAKYTVFLPAPPDKQTESAPARPLKREIPTSSGEGL
jgi:peptidyl-prolyl cis-trans isomerase C